MWNGVILLLAILLIILLTRRRIDAYTAYTIPKKIWTYWDDEAIPEFIHKCISKWRRLNPDWEIIIIQPSNVRHYIPDADVLNFKFANTPPRRSDFVRLRVMARYGGLWCDASIVPQKSFDWIIQEQEARKFEFMAYYRKSATRNPNFPVIESWMFACIPDCKFVEAWRDEMELMNDVAEESDYKNYLMNRGVDPQDIPQPDYLNVYLAAQAVLQKMDPEEIKRKIYVIESETGPFKHSIENDWNPEGAMRSLCSWSDLPDVIKLYGLERRAIDEDPNLQCVERIFA